MQFLKRETNYDFIGKQRLFLTVSLIVLGLAISVFVTRGLKFGIDFVGGTEIHVKFKKPISSLELRKHLSAHGLEDSVVQHFGSEAHNEYLVRLERSTQSLTSVTRDVEKVFTKIQGKEGFTIRKVDMVGPKVGDDLKKRGAWALFYALLGILIYVAIRFDYRYSPGGVVALVHDVIITLGLFALLGKKFDLTILAACLTIVGYSVNDTIVVFDRIRENITKYAGKDITSVINKSINETLSRTILTSLTTLLVVFILFYLGGEVIHDFAFVLLMGVLVGSYSSIFVASPTFLYLYKRSEKKV